MKNIFACNTVQINAYLIENGKAQGFKWLKSDKPGMSSYKHAYANFLQLYSKKTW